MTSTHTCPTRPARSGSVTGWSAASPIRARCSNGGRHFLYSTPNTGSLTSFVRSFDASSVIHLCAIDSVRLELPNVTTMAPGKRLRQHRPRESVFDQGPYAGLLQPRSPCVYQTATAYSAASGLDGLARSRNLRYLRSTYDRFGAGAGSPPPVCRHG